MTNEDESMELLTGHAYCGFFTRALSFCGGWAFCGAGSQRYEGLPGLL